jgi:hypothetical protein
MSVAGQKLTLRQDFYPMGVAYRSLYFVGHRFLQFPELPIMNTQFLKVLLCDRDNLHMNLGVRRLCHAPHFDAFNRAF